ncbi:cysteine proteinase [Meredithblackwellia eburnea MCA 4105]
MKKPSEYAVKLKEAQTTGTRATQLEHAGSFDQAFELYIKAAQSYLFLIRHTHDPVPKQRLRDVSKALLDRAERIKKAKKDAIRPVIRDRLSVEEQDSVVERGTTISGERFGRWKEADRDAQPLTQLHQPPLSPGQLAEGAVWTSSPPIPMIKENYSGVHIVQDNVDDCSLVAALIVGAEHHAKFGSKLVASSLFPQDSKGLPVKTIDSSLPATKDGRLLSCSTVDGDEMWPSLVEKAYMKLMGGYDFRGSNSSIDLYAISGWIPEYIPLRSSQFLSDRIWTRIYDGFMQGHCVVTLGTGSDPSTIIPSSGLVPSHNYAVVGVRVRQDGVRELQLINPWRSRRQAGTGTFAQDLTEALPREPLCVTWDVISMFFSSIYLNWDPEKFSFRDSVHCSIRKPSPIAQGQSTILRVQLNSASAPDSEVCLLLTRHQRTTADTGEFLGLVVGQGGGHRADRKPTRLAVDADTTLTDGPHVFYRFKATNGDLPYDIHISYRGPSAELGFTLCAFGHVPLKIIDGPTPLPYLHNITGKWSEKAAGGNHTCPTFMNNPQYKITLSSLPDRPSALAELEIRCETAKDCPVNLKLIRSRGDRIAEFEDRDLVAGSATYSYGLDACHTTDIRPDTYVLVVSTFRAGDEETFELSFGSSLPMTVTLVPPEGAGMFARSAKGSWEPGFDGGRSDILNNPTFSLTEITKPTSIKCTTASTLFLPHYTDRRVRLCASDGQQQITSTALQQWTIH